MSEYVHPTLIPATAPVFSALLSVNETKLEAFWAKKPFHASVHVLSRPNLLQTDAFQLRSPNFPTVLIDKTQPKHDKVCAYQVTFNDDYHPKHLRRREGCKWVGIVDKGIEGAHCVAVSLMDGGEWTAFPRAAGKPLHPFIHP